jgi:hypothetical protein
MVSPGPREEDSTQVLTGADGWEKDASERGKSCGDRTANELREFV